MKWWKRAFAVQPTGEFIPTDDQRAAIDRMCRWMVRRHLTTPAIVAFEMFRPLNFVMSQTIHFFDPVISIFRPNGGHRQVASFLEDRRSIEFILKRIEELESEAVAKEQPAVEASDEKAATEGTNDPQGTEA